MLRDVPKWEAIVCTLFVVLSSMFIIGNYQNHNGDFGQYYLHASNVLNGRNWGEYLAGKPAVLVGYPVLLMGPIAVFGLNGFAIGILNSILWAGTAFTFLLYYRERFKYRISGLVYVIFILFSPYALYFQQDGQPNIAYSAAFALSILSVHLLGSRPLTIWLAAGAILPAFFRIESAALFGAIGLWLILARNWRMLWIPIAGVVVTIGLDLLLDQISPVRSNILHALQVGERSGGINSSFLDTVNNISALFIGYVVSLAEIVGPHVLSKMYTFSYVADYGLTVRATIWSMILLVLCVIGFTLAKVEKHLDGIAGLAHLAMISLFVLPAIPIRYLLPVLPIVMFYLVFVIERAVSKALFGRSGIVTTSVLCCWLLMSAGIAVSNFRAVADIPRAQNSLITPDSLELASWLSTNQKGRLVGYWKERLIQVLLDAYGGDPGRTTEVRGAEKAERVLSDSGLVVLMKRPNFNSATLQSVSASPEALVVFENESFVVFAHR